MIDYNSIISNYREEMETDLELNQVNMDDVQMKLPALKHKWVGRLIRHKLELSQIQREKEKAISKACDNIVENNPVRMTQHATRAAAEKTDYIKQYNNQIEDLKILIEYLEKAERIFSSMTFDIKNLVQIITLETT